MKEMWGAGFAGSSPPFLGRERAAVDVDVGPERRNPRYHETCLACYDGANHSGGRMGRFFTNVAGKIKKLAGGAAGAGRRWLRRLRSQTQALTAQEATFEGRGEREEISLRQCVLRDHQIRSGSGLFIHSASTHHYTNRVSNRSVGQAPRLHRRIWQRRR